MTDEHMSRSAALALVEKIENEERLVQMESSERQLVIAALRCYAKRDRQSPIPLYPRRRRN